MNTIFRALRHRNFRLFFFGQGISLVGTWMQQIALSWLVYRLTNSALLLGLVVFWGQFPSLFITPFAGVLVDRYNKHRLIITTQTLAMIQSLILAFLVITHQIQIWHIILLNFFIGSIYAFDIPARHSFIIELIEDKDDLGNAIALNSSMFNIARLLGPSIAGIIIATIGEGLCFLLNGLSFIAVIAGLMLMKITPRETVSNGTSVLHELKEGFKYASGFKPIKSILLLLGLVSLVGVPYQVLMPIFAKDILLGNSRTLGFLSAMAGAGALVGALYLAKRKSVVGLDKVIATAALVFAIGVTIFSYSRFLWLSLFVIFFCGFGMMLNMAASNTLIQTLVEEDKRGRMMSFYSLAFMGTVPFGSLMAGTLASKLGAPVTTSIGGICCLIGTLIFIKNLPAINKIINPIYVKKGIMTAEESVLQERI